MRVFIPDWSSRLKSRDKDSPAQKLQQAGQNLETINGRPFEVVTFKTAIAAARAGKFEIGPVKAKAQVVVPRRRNAPRSRSPFDLFDLDDPFSDPFFSNPFAQFGERRDIQISSDPVALEVKPLPPNAPAEFFRSDWELYHGN